MFEWVAFISLAEKENQNRIIMRLKMTINEDKTYLGNVSAYFAEHSTLYLIIAIVRICGTFN